MLSFRRLEIEIVGLSDGRVGIRADAEVVWILPRAAEERIPPAGLFSVHDEVSGRI
jgi:hypothetical protein